MTKPATKPIDLRATFDFHAGPFTREIATDDHLRLPFLDEALAGLLSTIAALMPAALIAPVGTGKTTLLRRLHASVGGTDAGFPATSNDSSTTKGKRR